MRPVAKAGSPGNEGQHLGQEGTDVTHHCGLLHRLA